MSIKQLFEVVVSENTAWLFAYVKSKLKNKDLAEDLMQEIWIKTYRAYDNYFEDGKIKSWLFRIAQNHLRNYFSKSSPPDSVSLDDDDENSLYTYLSSGATPEEDYIHKELIAEVLLVVSGLSKEQRQIVTYRFIDGFTVGETAALMDIPLGTVKSKTHYALDRIRKKLDFTIQKQKGDFIMDCRNIYKYLFMYAKGALKDEDKDIVKNHISECKTCHDVVKALEKLIPVMTFAGEDENSHFLIDFPELKLSYCGMGYEIQDYERLNKHLESWSGKIPDNETWMTSGYSKCNTLIGAFDNEGNEIKFSVFEDDGKHCRVKATYLKKVYQRMWLYEVFTYESLPYSFTKSQEAPNLYYGSMHKCFGGQVKSALYQAVPSKAENIRIKRGNGVIDCDTYKFPYVDRYVAEEERLSLDYSFLLNK